MYVYTGVMISNKYDTLLNGQVRFSSHDDGWVDVWEDGGGCKYAQHDWDSPFILGISHTPVRIICN